MYTVHPPLPFLYLASSTLPQPARVLASASRDRQADNRCHTSYAFWVQIEQIFTVEILCFCFKKTSDVSDNKLKSIIFVFQFSTILYTLTIKLAMCVFGVGETAQII